MPSHQPFSPMTTATTGRTVSLVVESTSVSVVLSLSAFAPTLLVTCVGPAGVAPFWRAGSATTQTATVADVPMPTGMSRIFATQLPSIATSVTTPTITIAAICSLTTTPVTLFFTPGIGGP